MRRQHFAALRPVCPVCSLGTSQPHPLELAAVCREQDELVLEGVLHCSNPSCQREYPIIDGIPLIIRDIRAYLSENVFQVCQRDELSQTIESMLGDCAGPGSTFDVTRQHLSSYTWDHYGDLDPMEAHDPCPGSMLRVLESGLALAGNIPPGPILDVGCSVGRSSFELAQRSQQLVLGIDMNYAMLRLAQAVLHSEVVAYPRRRVGLVYDRRQFPVSFEQMKNVDFWACDASALPFADRQFSTVVSLNTLDCSHSPLDFLSSLDRILGDDCPAIMACPYDWAAAATPMEGWLGGHSQRGPDAGASEPVLRRLLSGGHPTSIPRLRLVDECEQRWNVRLHERSTVAYGTHVVCARTIT